RRGAGRGRGPEDRPVPGAVPRAGEGQPGAVTPRARAIGYGALRALRGLRRRPWTTALAVGAIAVSALLVALVHLAATNVERLTAAWSGGVQMIVYLTEDASVARADEIAAALTRLPAVEQVAYVSPAEAHERLRAALG